MNAEYSLGYVRGLADTHGSLHLISDEHKKQRAMTFRTLDKAVLDELALNLDVLGYEDKRYVQSAGKERLAQQMLRIHKQDEVRRFCKEIGFRRQDRGRRANKFLADEISQRK